MITALDGKSVTSGTDITSILVGLHPGDKVSITWTDTTGSRTPRRSRSPPGPPPEPPSAA